MNQRLKVSQKWSFFPVRSHALVLYLSGVIALSFFETASLAHAQQATPLSVAPESETQEEFGAHEIPIGNMDSQQDSAINGMQTTVGASPTIGGAGQFDFNNDGHPDFLLFNANNRRTVIWYMNNNIHFASNHAPNVPCCEWRIASVADFNQDGHPDLLLFNRGTFQTVIRYLVGATYLTGKSGPTLPGGWEVVATSDFNGNGRPDLVLYHPSTPFVPGGQTAIWYMNNNLHVVSATGPTLPSGWNLVAVADFNGDDHPDYVLFRPSSGRSVIWYMSGATHISSRSGPTLPLGYDLVGAADFDGDERPDYVLYDSSTRQTAIWYMNDNVFVGSASGPTLPSGWSLVAP